MFSKKILPFITLFFLMMSSYGHAQIVTSKKIAIQKGIYKKPEEKKTEAAGVTGGEQKVAEKTEASSTGGTAASQPPEMPKTEAGVTGTAVEGNKELTGSTGTASTTGASATGAQTTLSEQESKEKRKI
jgi:hypothetical protein